MNSSLLFLLHKFPFSDSSVIAKGFCSELGVVSFILKGSKRLKSTNKLDYFNLYQINFNYQSKKNLQNLNQVFIESEFTNVKGDFNRQSLVNVILEIYLRYLQGLEDPQPLFQYLKSTLETVDLLKVKVNDFPMILCDFLLGFLYLLGLSPQFNCCTQCQATTWKSILFVFETGGIMCSKCFAKEKGSFKFERISMFDLLTLRQLKKRNFSFVNCSLNKGFFLEQLLINFLNSKTETTSRIYSLKTYRDMIHQL